MKSVGRARARSKAITDDDRADAQLRMLEKGIDPTTADAKLRNGYAKNVALERDKRALREQAAHAQIAAMPAAAHDVEAEVDALRSRRAAIRAPKIDRAAQFGEAARLARQVAAELIEEADTLEQWAANVKSGHAPTDAILETIEWRLRWLGEIRRAAAEKAINPRAIEVAVTVHLAFARLQRGRKIPANFKSKFFATKPIHDYYQRVANDPAALLEHLCLCIRDEMPELALNDRVDPKILASLATARDEGVKKGGKAYWGPIAEFAGAVLGVIPPTKTAIEKAARDRRNRIAK